MGEDNHEITVQLTVNDQGIAHSPIPSDAHVHVAVSTAAVKQSGDPDLPLQTNSITVLGNQLGLIALAEQLLAIAHTDVEGYHQHFDAEDFAGFFESDGDWELIVGRNDVRAIRRDISDS